VMAHESFEDETTAALLNEHFVPVKVDREERPDVDSVYMDAVVSLTGHGGWPLTVFLTPKGEPFFGGTYYPPEPRHGLPSFSELLQAVADAWRDRRGDIERDAGRLFAEIGLDDFQSSRAPDKRYRTTPLHGLFVHTKGGFFHDGRFATLLDVVNHYNSFMILGLTEAEKSDVVEYLKSL